MRAAFLPIAVLTLSAAVLIGGGAQARAAGTAPHILVVKFDNDINPVTADFLDGEINRANNGHYTALLIEFNTLGGLTDSMDKIVNKELASKVPVIVYIAPQGAGAGSAGTFISEAADVLAMAPETTIGAATPIGESGNLPTDLRRKAINFYGHKLASIAAAHGRNGTWGIAAVKVASARTANEAVAQHIADLEASSLPALLKKIDGRRTKPKGFVLHTAGAQLTTVKEGLWSRILDALIDPNVISLMLTLGVLGIIVELWHPGLIFPASFGILCLAIAFFGLDVLPIDWAGLVLIGAAFAFWITELFFAFSHGALTLAGAACFVFGSLLLFQPAGSGYQVSIWVALAVAGTVSLFFAFALAKVVQVRRQPATVGPQMIVGAVGQVREDGLVAVRGELWQARDADEAPLVEGEDVEVIALDGLSLVVRRAPAPMAV